MRRLRLLVTEQCNRSCHGCCNKDWDLGGLPTIRDYTTYHEVILTGGEPLLTPDWVLSIVHDIRKQSTVPIYLYTAKVDETFDALRVLAAIDGMTVTLHDNCDVEPFKLFAAHTRRWHERGRYRSLRVNIFKGVDTTGVDFHPWHVKDTEWRKDYTLPEGEVFGRYSNVRHW